MIELMFVYNESMEAVTDPESALAALRATVVEHADSAECDELLLHVRRLRGWVDATEARITSRARELHASAGAAPAADRHARCGGVSSAEGKRKERRSETLDEAPSCGDALAAGTIGAEHVDALANATARLDDDVKAAVLDHESDLLADATRLSPEQFAKTCRGLARLLEHDHGISRNERHRRETHLSRRIDPATGMVVGRFAFHPELANQVFGAVDREVAAMIAEGTRAGDAEFVDRSVDRNRLAAEALGRLVAGGHQQARPLEADITLIVDVRTAATGELHDHSICETSDGIDLPPASVRRLCCQGRVTPIVVDQHGNPFDMGRQVRHANRNQRRALRAMYRCCAFDGCDVAFDRCEIHHILPWELGGPTDLANLIPLCSRHHHVVHEGGWTLHLAPDRTLTITQPDGVVFARCRPDMSPTRGSAPDRRRPAA